VATPPATAPPAAAAPPPRPAPKPAARPRSDSAEATQYVTVPGLAKGELVGVLVGIDGELKGQMFAVMDGDNKLGRAQECEVNLLDPKISREHAMIACEDGVLLILPLSDKNPVYLNDEIVDEGDQLSDGDKLRLGNPGSSSFRFRTIDGL
jgi:pSer/pThr/pTyr-binding forkhead associated (FHA) protein